MEEEYPVAVACWYLPRCTEEYHENFNKNNRPPNRGSNQELSEYCHVYEEL
jgi:hypothetical protein